MVREEEEEKKQAQVLVLSYRLACKQFKDKRSQMLLVSQQSQWRGPASHLFISLL